MEKIFFGKISKRFPQQYKDNFYAGGKEDSSWYNGLQIGDFVFPIYQQVISKLWKVKAFDNSLNSVSDDGSVQFEVVKDFSIPISISTAFARYRHFELNLTMLNKSVKSTAAEKMGFYPIACDSVCPSADKIDFTDIRNIYIALEIPFQKLSFKESDIRLLIDDKDSLKIKEVQIFQNGTFIRYDLLDNLYLSKNVADKRYSLKELLEYAISDLAVKKEKFLIAAIDGIKKDGYYLVTSPISLYDNVLVGRKKTSRAKKEGKDDTNETEDEFEPPLSSEEFEEYKEYVDLLKFSPNLILYGPPGTGKTYSVEKIIEAFEYDRTGEELSFKEIQDEGRISFVTFHQSFSYEEFVEGIRPVLSDDEKGDNIEEGDNLKYKVQDGILKQIANKAALSQITLESSNDLKFSKLNEDSRIWKIALGERFKEEDIYKSCIETNTIAIGWFNETNITDWNYDKIYSELKVNLSEDSPKPINSANSINNFVNILTEGDLVLVFESQNTIRAIGIVDGPYEWREELVKKYPHRRKVNWLKIFDLPINIVKYNGGKKLSQVTLYELNNIKFLDIKELLDIDKTSDNKELKKAIPYFLVIDEINRGNISKIFGELITLLEKDKRDRINTILPYSQKPFSLPSNLYFIGTMNTADRSIAVLDTALRRRFLFKEIEPSIEVIKTSNYLIEDDLDLSILAEKLNVKINKRLDRDHRLGHSYFMDVYDISQFKIRWYYQIIPLLMEYFYNDFESIAEIISDEFIDKANSQVLWISDDKSFKFALLNIQ